MLFGFYFKLKHAINKNNFFTLLCVSACHKQKKKKKRETSLQPFSVISVGQEQTGFSALKYKMTS